MRHPILRKNNFTDRISVLMTYIAPQNFKTGKIINVNTDGGSVIIEELNTNKTFLGHKSKFIPLIENLTSKIHDLIVSFVASIQGMNGEERRQAKNIRITTK